MERSDDDAIRGEHWGTMKILVVDDHPLFLSGIRTVLERLADEVTILEAGSAEAAFSHIEREPDIDFLCLDLQLPGMDGIEFLGELRRRRVPVPVLILSAQESPAVIDRALRAGANGYVSKHATRDELALGLATVAKTGRFLSAALRRPLDDYRAGIRQAGAGAVRLTRRQRQILRLLADGLANTAIANQLGIAESTVKGHLVALYAALDAETRTACIARARDLGLLDAGI